MNKRIQDLLNGNFRDIKGASATVELPVSEALLNALLAEAQTPEITNPKISILPDDEFSLSLTIVKGISYSKEFRFKIVNPSLPDDPVLCLRILSGFNLLDGLLVSLLQGLANDHLPKGVKLQMKTKDDKITIHLRQLCESYEASEYYPLLDGLELHTAKKKLVITLKASAK